MNNLRVELKSSTILLWLIIPLFVLIGYFQFISIYLDFHGYYFLSVFLIYLLSVYLIKIFFAHRYFPKDNSETNKNIDGKSFVLPLTTLSPDFILTKIIKEEHIPFKIVALKSDKLKIKNSKKQLLKTYNYFNILLSIVLVLFITLGYFKSKVLIMLLILRTISRSLEIIFSFISDVMEKEKTSNLKPSERLKLAITSYIELIILYTGVYALIGYMPVEETFDIQILIDNLLLSVGHMTFTDVNFNYYFKDGISIKLNEIKYFFLFQIITSFILVIFAIASYIGDLKK